MAKLILVITLEGFYEDLNWKSVWLIKADYKRTLLLLNREFGIWLIYAVINHAVFGGPEPSWGPASSHQCGCRQITPTLLCGDN
jgi:hypothetical protein